MASRKRRSCDGRPGQYVIQNETPLTLGCAYVTPQGLALVSEPLYPEYREREELMTHRFRPVVHCQSRKWWLQSSVDHLAALGVMDGYIFTDQPPRQWGISSAHAVISPRIYPILHRRRGLSDMRALQAAFVLNKSPDLVRKAVLNEAEKIFKLNLGCAWESIELNHEQVKSSFQRIKMLKGQLEKHACRVCKKMHISVCRIDQLHTCNRCARQIHALVKFCERIPSSVIERKKEHAFAALVDCCLTIEENFRAESCRVLDYSRCSDHQI